MGECEQQSARSLRPDQNRLFYPDFLHAFVAAGSADFRTLHIKTQAQSFPVGFEMEIPESTPQLPPQAGGGCPRGRRGGLGAGGCALAVPLERLSLQQGCSSVVLLRGVIRKPSSCQPALFMLVYFV